MEDQGANAFFCFLGISGMFYLWNLSKIRASATDVWHSKDFIIKAVERPVGARNISFQL